MSKTEIIDQQKVEHLAANAIISEAVEIKRKVRSLLDDMDRTYFKAALLLDSARKREILDKDDPGVDDLMDRSLSKLKRLRKVATDLVDADLGVFCGVRDLIEKSNVPQGDLYELLEEQTDKIHLIYNLTGEIFELFYYAWKGVRLEGISKMFLTAEYIPEHEEVLNHLQ